MIKMIRTGGLQCIWGTPEKILQTNIDKYLAYHKPKHIWSKYLGSASFYRESFHLKPFDRKTTFYRIANQPKAV
jgi:hypothetical protein